MNLHFEKYLKILQSGDDDAIHKTLKELHRSFASLTQEEQKFANIFLHDIQRGDAVIQPDRSFKDYIVEYQSNAKNREIATLVNQLGIDESKLLAMMNTQITDENIDEYGRFGELKATVDRQKAKSYFQGIVKEDIPPYKVNMHTDKLLRKFIVAGGFELEMADKNDSAQKGE
jgi:type I restriction enzyme R subunit